MGFHAVAVGAVLADHSDWTLQQWLKLVAKDYKIHDGDTLITPADLEKLLEERESGSENENDLSKYSIEFTLHDDLCLVGSKKRTIKLDVDDDLISEILFYTKLVNRHQPQISVGMPHCCTTMIYLGCVGDDCGGEMEPLHLSPALIEYYTQWIVTLVKEERLIMPTSLFSLVPNCCS